MLRLRRLTANTFVIIQNTWHGDIDASNEFENKKKKNELWPRL